jgi:hypothetical protein
MAKFDPKNPPSADSSDGVAPGDYILAMTNFIRKTAAKTGNAYLRARFVVCAGVAKGKSFYAAVSLNYTSPGIAARLSMYCEQVGMLEAFDPDDDRELRAVFVGRPFFARVSRKVDGQYVNNDIERFLNKEAQHEKVQAAMALWLKEEEARRNIEDQGGGDQRDYDFGGGDGGGYVDDQGMPSDRFNAPIDDDIPF